MPLSSGYYGYQRPAYEGWSTPSLGGDYSDLARGGKGPFMGWTAPIPMRMGQLGAGIFDWLNQTGPVPIGLAPDFEERQYEQFGRIMGRQQKDTEKQIKQRYARLGKTGSPQYEAALRQNMLQSQFALGDVIQASAMQNALRRLEESRLAATQQLQWADVVGGWARGNLPGYRPSQHADGGGGFGGFLGQGLGLGLGMLLPGIGGSMANLFRPNANSSLSNMIGINPYTGLREDLFVSP